MKQRFRLYRRRKGGMFYSHDSETGKQESLGTKIKSEALLLLNGKNESVRQPALNLQLARTYLRATDPEVATRTWQVAMDEATRTKSGDTRHRYETAMKDRAYDLIRQTPILKTQASDLFKVMRNGTVATNVFLRRIHNFCLDLNWLPWPLIPKRHWPKVKFQEKRAITLQEHQALVRCEANPERRAFYELCWHLGGSQTDVAQLQAEDIDWDNRVISYSRKKTKELAFVHFGDELQRILRALPNSGPLFPKLQHMRAAHRATEFKRCCRRAGVSGVTPHCYRYAWAERAKQSGYPERFAQEALGHNSKAVHRAYAKKAKVTLPSLEDYEKLSVEGKVIPLKIQTGTGTQAGSS